MSASIVVKPNSLRQVANSIRRGNEQNVIALKNKINTSLANNSAFGSKKEQRLDALWSVMITNVGNAGFSMLNSTFSSSYDRAIAGTPERRAVQNISNHSIPSGLTDSFSGAISPRPSSADVRFFLSGAPWSSAQSEINSTFREIAALAMEIDNTLAVRLANIEGFIMQSPYSRQTGWRGEVATQAFVSRLNFLEKYLEQVLEGVDRRSGNPDAIVASIEDAFTTANKHIDLSSQKTNEVSNQSEALANNRTLFDQQTANMLAGGGGSADVGEIPRSEVQLKIHIADLLSDGRGLQGAFEDQLEDRYQELSTNITKLIFDVADFFANPGGVNIQSHCAKLQTAIKRWVDLMGRSVEAEVRTSEVQESLCPTSGLTRRNTIRTWQPRRGIGTLGSFVNRGITEDITALLPVATAWEKAFDTTDNRAKEMVSNMNGDAHLRRLRERAGQAMYDDAEFSEVLRTVDLIEMHLNTQRGIFNRYASIVLTTMNGAATNALVGEIRTTERFNGAIIETLERDFGYGTVVNYEQSGGNGYTEKVALGTVGGILGNINPSNSVAWTVAGGTVNVVNRIRNGENPGRAFMDTAGAVLFSEGVKYGVKKAGVSVVNGITAASKSKVVTTLAAGKGVKAVAATAVVGAGKVIAGIAAIGLAKVIIPAVAVAAVGVAVIAGIGWIGRRLRGAS